MATTTITRVRATPVSSPSASSPSLRSISYAELEKHSGGYGDAWTAVNGKVYDITEFSKTHPGGEIIRFAAGRDATCLVESYHSLTSTARVTAALSSKCECIGVLTDGPEGTPTKEFKPDSQFFHTVRARVEAHLKKNQVNKSVYNTMYVIESFLTCALYLLASYYVSFHGSYGWCLVLGFLTGRMGFVMHSGNHCAAGRSPVVNSIIGYFMDIIGSNKLIWGYEHQVAHHCDPNEHKRDNDCEIGNPIVRMHPAIESNPWQAYQHITVPLGITIGLLKWYAGDIGHFIRGRVGNCAMTITTSDWFQLLVFKTAWFVFHVLVPAYYFGVVYACLSALLFMGLGGHYIENIFIVNHIQNGCVPPVTMHWANKQVMATCNWGSRNFWCNLVSGGLNHQIEHHLFPSLSVYLYPTISPIVQQTCKEFGLPYHNFDNFATAWMAMWNYLKELGKQEGTNEIHTESSKSKAN